MIQELQNKDFCMVHPIFTEFTNYYPIDDPTDEHIEGLDCKCNPTLRSNVFFNYIGVIEHKKQT